jgi:nitrogen fixation-related uncharacterized protein
MIELMINMALCLGVALLIGFFVGWLFAKALGAEEYDMDYNELSSNEDEHSRQIKALKQKCEKEKILRTNEEKKNKELKFELMKKATLLKNLQKVQEVDSTDNNEKLTRVENLLKEKEAELAEFESVLVKAEKTIEELRGK